MVENITLNTIIIIHKYNYKQLYLLFQITINTIKNNPLKYLI